MKWEVLVTTCKEVMVRMILSYPDLRYVPSSINVRSSKHLQKAKKVDGSDYYISNDMFAGTYDNIEVTPGLF